MAQNDQPVKLSKAMFRAAGLLPQITLAYFRRDEQRNIVGACALGCVLYADRVIGQEPGQNAANLWIGDQHFRDTYSVALNLHGVTNPATNTAEKLYNVIVYLNDEEKWSVRRIAAWLRSIGL